MVDLALLETVFLVAMGGWLVVLAGAFLLARRQIDRPSAVLLLLAGVYAILWQQPALLGVGQAFHVAVAQPTFLLLLSGAIFLWTYWLFERHVERLEEALEGLEGALSLERTLVDVLSHDLQNPMAAARLDVQQMAREHPAFADRLAGIEKKIQRAADVMDNGIVYSRLASQSDSPPMAELDLVEQVQRAVQDVRLSADTKGVEVAVEAPDELRLVASPLIERAIGNLVDNAIKYSPDEGTVRVRVDEVRQGAQIAVSDEGPGIPPEERETLLERFCGDPDSAEGSGLGLAIVRRLVDLHDGRLEIREAGSGGALIEMEIPTASASALGTRPVRTCENDTGVSNLPNGPLVWRPGEP